MAKYIKSVRIRRKFANGFDSKSELDIRVAIYDKAFSKRSVLGVEATVREETDARNGTNIIADPEKLNKIWPEVDYSGNRYKDLTDDEVLADYIRTQSKLSSVEYSIIQDPWIIEAPIFRNFGFDPYYLNNGTELYVKWFKFDDDIWEEVPGTYESGKTGSIPNVIDIKRNEPVSGGTVSANSGDRYLVGKNPTGPNWSKYGNSYNIVEWNSFGKFWQQTFLEDGMTVYVDLEEVQYKYSSGSPVIVTGGTEWSDKKGNEMEMTSSDYLIKLQGGTPSNLKSKIVKKVETINQKSNEMLMLSEDNKIVKYGLSASREIPSNIDDTDIVRRFIDDWKSMVPNYDLKLCSPSNQKCELIEYISPIQPLPGPSVDPTGASPSGVTGASGSYKQKLTIVFPEDFKVMAREDVPKFSIWIGEPQTEEVVDEFDFGPDSPFVIDEEYVEGYYEGPEEDFDETSGVSFNRSEILRDDDPPIVEASTTQQKADGVEFGGDKVTAPSGSVSKTSVSVPSELEGVQNSKVLKKQDTGSGLRDIIDIKSPTGDKIKGEDIIRDMNQFIQDVLGPFAKWLKSKYPDVYKNWYITSATRGYVPKGGSLTSQHYRGQAIDSCYLGSRKKNPEGNIKLMNAILEWYKENPVGYGQILFETRDPSSCWIHWSYTRGVKRLMFARFDNDTTKAASANKKGSYVLPPLTKSSLGF